MALLMDQSRSVPPLRSAKARELRELWREKCMRALWTSPFKLARTSFFFSAGHNRQMKSAFRVVFPHLLYLAVVHLHLPSFIKILNNMIIIYVHSSHRSLLKDFCIMLVVCLNIFLYIILFVRYSIFCLYIYIFSYFT